MTNIIFKNSRGEIEGAINTHHNDPPFIRELAADAIGSSRGAFGGFGKLGDSITVERGLPVGLGLNPGEGKLEKLCSGNYLPSEESHSTVSLYHIVDEALMWELEQLHDEGDRGGYSRLVQSILNLEDYFGEVAPGERYTTYTVERVALDLVAVIETESINV